jgi:hypothetical protein
MNTSEEFSKTMLSNAESSRALSDSIGIAECLTLVKAVHNYVASHEEIDPSEEDLLASFENELAADSVAEDFAHELNRTVDMEAPEATSFLQSFRDWSAKGRRLPRPGGCNG